FWPAGGASENLRSGIPTGRHSNSFSKMDAALLVILAAPASRRRIFCPTVGKIACTIPALPRRTSN
ncbi:MAG: hypothetical protein ACRD4Y_13440, partial [Candidatus Acidiferrales bacterium]